MLLHLILYSRTRDILGAWSSSYCLEISRDAQNLGLCIQYNLRSDCHLLYRHPCRGDSLKLVYWVKFKHGSKQLPKKDNSPCQEAGSSCQTMLTDLHHNQQLNRFIYNLLCICFPLHTLLQQRKYFMADIGIKYEQKATFQPFLRFFKRFHFLDRVHKPRPHTSVS